MKTQSNFSIIPYLKLTRPANLVTALSDILAGMAIGQFLFSESSPYWLLAATLGLYGGGVVMNDVFDAKLDAIERPERPIPSGRVSLVAAATMGISLLLLGIVFSAFHSSTSALIAVGIAISTIIYNRFAKHSKVAGPFMMGVCRGGNLLLGISAVTVSIATWWPITVIPIIYIAAITLISQDEVHGGQKRTLIIAALFYLIVHAVQISIAIQQGNGLLALPFILAHAWLIGKPLFNAWQNPIGPLIGKAVKAGVISLIIMNAAWCVTFGYWPLALIVVLLLPLSIALGKYFAVT